MPNVKRDKNNRRVFDAHDIAWIKDLVCLKKCGMSIQEMKVYLALCLQGPGTIPRRKVMLAEKQRALRAQIAELEDSAAFIDWKQSFYDDVLAERFDGLPPAYLEVEQFDCLHDEGLAYADALEGAGVPVQRQEVAGTVHGFDVFRDAPIVRTMIETRSRALRAAFGTAEGGR